MRPEPPSNPTEKPVEGPAPPSDRAPLNDVFFDLRLRTLSGVLLGVAAAGAIYLGGWVTALLSAAGAAAMAWEYRGFVRFDPSTRSRQKFLAVAFAATAFAAPILAFSADEFWVAGLFALAAALVFWLIDGHRGRWTGPGFLVIAASTAAFVWMRELPQYGLATTIWLVCVVVATDVGGYFAGRLIGGPKLAPKLSPKKTWSGLAGGIGLAFIVGGLFSYFTTGTYAEEVCTVSAIAALLAVAGDLGESRLKRRFGVKDASNLIPGHGGALDRLDGLMAATLVAAVVTFVRGKEIFIW